MHPATNLLKCSFVHLFGIVCMCVLSPVPRFSLTGILKSTLLLLLGRDGGAFRFLKVKVSV
jgi:hypothetical protein